MFSKGDFKDKSCGKDVCSEGDFKDKSCWKDVFSIGASKDKSCRKDVLSEGASKDKLWMCLAWVGAFKDMLCHKGCV